jgi:hypothetical protein
VLFELHAAVLATVKRLLAEMSLDERVRRQVRLARTTRTRVPRAAVRGVTTPPAHGRHPLGSRGRRRAPRRED